MIAAFPSPCCKAHSRFLRVEAGTMQFSCLACRNTWTHGSQPPPRSSKAEKAPRRHRVSRAARKLAGGVS